MATISGRVLFDRYRTAVPADGMEGIANVPVVLQDTATNDMLAISTEPDGSYIFNDVPIGNYRIVEAYGITTIVFPSPGDFNNQKTQGTEQLAVVPPINGFVNNPPAGATNLDCTSPNTILVSVNDLSDTIINQFILNGPVKYSPIGPLTDRCAVITSENLIVDAEYGTMGYFPPGTAPDTGVPVEPFPANVPDFKYVLPPEEGQFIPDDGEYSVQNLVTDSGANRLGTWWRIADHTRGNETGRMMVVNGYNPGSVFYTETVAVKENTNYLFSVWILNLIKLTNPPVPLADPALGVKILASDGDVLFSATLGAQIPVNPNEPEWKQIGTVIDSMDHDSLTVQFLSEGLATYGNDYAIDDITLQEIDVPVFSPRKSVSESRVAVGGTVTYTVTLTNTCASPLTDVHFQDLIPPGLEFVPDSVTIDNTPVTGVNPADGFGIPNIGGDATVTVTFEATAVSVPEVNPTPNTANMSYKYTPVEYGIPMLYNAASNLVPLRINPPFCQVVSVAFQRERNEEDPIASDGIVTFNKPLLYPQIILYQPDGKIDILRRGTYIVFWFVAGMTGFSTDGQSYQLKKLDYNSAVPGAEPTEWTDLAKSTNHIKNDATPGFSIVNVTADDINEHGRATIALFNTADAEITLTFFHPKAGILIFGADFDCINDMITTFKNNLTDIDARIQLLDRFLQLSGLTQEMSQTPELSGLGVAVISIGFNYNFWGIGALDAGQTLSGGESYYLMRRSQFQPLSFYQGASTTGTLWIEQPAVSTVKYPIHFDETGIYFIPPADLTLIAGTKFSFTQSLILVDPSVGL